MPYLHHGWFDPTSLMSRNIQWSVPATDLFQRRSNEEHLRVAFQKDIEPNKFALPRRRGRQRHVVNPVPMCWQSDIIQSLGVYGNDTEKYATYILKLGQTPLGVIGLHTWLEAGAAHIQLDMIFVVQEWRRRGLATSVVEHAGRWAAAGLQAWAPTATSFIVHTDTHDAISVRLASLFFQRVQEHTRMLNYIEPQWQWNIVTEI